MNYCRGIRINLILLLILIILSFILFIKKDTGDNTDNLSEGIPFLQYNVSDISAIAIVNNTSRFGIIHRDGTLTLAPELGPLPISTREMQSFLFRFSKLQAQGKFRKNKDLSLYGLDPPQAKGTIILNNGDKVRLFLGKRNQLNSTYYITRESDDYIYIINDADGELFLRDSSSFIAKDVLPEVDLKDLNLLKSIKITHGNKSLPSFKIENQGNFIFIISEPYNNPLDYERVLSDLIFPVLSLSPEKRLEGVGDVDLSELEDLYMEVQIGEEYYNLVLFRSVDNTVYLIRDGVSGVFILKSRDVPFFDLHYLDLLNDSIYHCNVSEVESLMVEDFSRGINYNIDISGDSVNLNGVINNVSIGYKQIMELFEVLFETGILKDFPLGIKLDSDVSVVLKITIHKKSGNMDQLEFAASENGLILFLNGVAHFETYNKTVLDINRALSALVGK